MMLLVHQVEQVVDVEGPMKPIHASITEKDKEQKLPKFVPKRYFPRPEIIKLCVSANLSNEDWDGEDI